MQLLFSLLALTIGLVDTVQAVTADKDAVNCLALNLYWEARGEGRAGMVAVGWVVLNRAKDSRYPDGICAVIQQGGERPPCAWSWWCDGKSDRPKEPKAWALAQEIARQMLHDPPRDPTHGALWFHLESIKKPKWVKGRKRTRRIGRHIFYR